LQGKGKVDEAIECYQKAIKLDPKIAEAHNNLGLVLHGKGKVDEAIACFQKAIALAPKDANAHNNLGFALQGKGNVDKAIECYKQAIAIDSRHVKAHTNLGGALQGKGKGDEAVGCFHKAIAVDPSCADAHGGLGWALMRQGQFSEAQKALRCCLGLLPPSHPRRSVASRLLWQCQQLLDADGKLNAFLAGKEAPTDAVTLVQMAVLAHQPFRRHYLTAARLYRDAFARQPLLAETQRYNAACAAALAGTGQGKDTAGIDDTDRAELRYSALSWLQDHLKGRVWQLGSTRPGSAEQVRQTLLHWRKNADLAAVRAPSSLGKLPEAEQVAWLNLWAQVDALLARTKPGK
jgi:tetratricopeptide (TPR) repeat protein